MKTRPSGADDHSATDGHAARGRAAVDVEPIIRISLETLVPFLEKAMSGWNPGARKPPRIGVLTFREVIRFFTEEHPGDPRIESGALLQRPYADGHLCFQVFLDGRDTICLGSDGSAYGRSLVCNTFDHELIELFRGDDLIVFR